MILKKYIIMEINKEKKCYVSPCIQLYALAGDVILHEPSAGIHGSIGGWPSGGTLAKKAWDFEEDSEESRNVSAKSDSTK